MLNAPFVVGVRVNRTKVLFTTEDNIKQAGFTQRVLFEQSGKSGKTRRLPAASGKGGVRK